MSVADNVMDLERTLHEWFGLQRFRPGQREVIEEVVQGRDVLCVMPTGGGKSLCYQLPALLLPRLTLVVSPLIALMKDQVDALVQRGVAATLLNSSLEPAEQSQRLREIEAGQYSLVYVAPERFRSMRFLEAMGRIRPSLLAVDEAHCISEWGHDFRPDYAKLGLARRRLGSPACIALTATATDIVRRDIAEQLDLKDPAQFVTGFDRPNLSYSVTEARRDPDKLAALAEILAHTPGPSVVYASSRNRCEAVGQFLEQELNRSVAVYHAGLGREERTQAQERFMSGEADVVVATNAFGMGVDKADIRSVIHFNLPGTLEAYYQEAGRAGRDGNPARCVLLFAPGDRFLQEMFIENEYPPADIVFRVFNYLRALDADPIELTHAEIREAAGIELNESAVGTAIKILEGAGALEKFLPRENMAIVRINAEPDDPSLAQRLGPQAHVQRIVMLGLEAIVNRRFSEPIYFHPDDFARTLGLDRPALTRAIRALSADLPVDYIPPFRGNAIRVIDRNRRARDLEIDFSALEQRKQREYDKLERMFRYAQTHQCRRAYILGYFGDAAGSRVHCGHCDNCGIDGEASPSQRGSIVETAAGREVVLKTLSGVARAKGRFGKTIISQMLTGSGSEKMDRWGLKRLSTYGILSAFRQPEVAQLMDALAYAGFVEYPEVDRFRPVANLTARGRELLKGQIAHPIILNLPDALAAKLQARSVDAGNAPTTQTPARPELANPTPAATDDSPGEAEPAATGLESDPLWIHLKELRSEWAREAKQPPYMVFNNQTLEALVHARPSNPKDLAEIKGLGAAKRERYGLALLAAIKRFSAPSPSTPHGASLAPGDFEEPESSTDAAPPLTSRPSVVPELVPPSAKPPQQPELSPSPPPTPRATTERPSPSPPAQAPALPPTSAPVAPGQTSSSAPSTHYIPTEEWTCRLLERGFTLDEAASIRGLELTAILRHLSLAVRQGRSLQPEHFLPKAVHQRWEAWGQEHGFDTAPPDLELPEPLWVLFHTCRNRP